MSDGTNDRGVQAPRTLFSLGRASSGAPGPEAAVDVIPDTDTDNDTAPGPETSPTDVGGTIFNDATPQETSSATESDVDSGYLCGACDAPLPVGAIYCAECGTPVAGMAAEDPDSSDDHDPSSGLEPVPDLEPTVDRVGDPGLGAVYDASPDIPSANASDRTSMPGGESGPDGTSIGFEERPEPDLEADEPAGVTQPAAILYRDGAPHEPLVEPQGTWNISEAAIGTSTGAFIYGEPDEAGDEPDDGSGGDAWTFPTPAAVGAVSAGVAMPFETAPGSPADGQVALTTPAGVTSVTPVVPYGGGPVDANKTASGSKTPLIIGVAVAVVLVLLVGGVLIASGGKDDSKAETDAASGAPQTTTTTVKSQTSTTAGVVTSTTVVATTPSSVPPESSAPPVSVDTTAVTPTASVAPPIAPPVTAPVTRPPPTQPSIRPGQITATPATNQSVTIPKQGSTQIVLQNTGSVPASCAVSIGRGNLRISSNCSPGIPAGGTVIITVTANPGFEGAGVITGLMEGLGNYSLSIFVQNGG